MKLSYVGAVVALGAAALLSACGGKAQFTVQGTISGLATPGLVLTNGGETLSVPAGATTFAFTRQIDYGTDYAIAIQKDPDHMTCQIGNNTGSAGHTVSIAAVIQCQRKTYTLGGQFTGLTQGPAVPPATTLTNRTLTLLNGSAGGSVTLTSPASGSGAGDFIFSTAVADGQSYGVTIVPESVPADLNCAIKNQTGIVTNANISNVLVECTPK